MPRAIGLDEGANLFGSALWPCRFGFRGPRRGRLWHLLWRVRPKGKQCKREAI